MRGYLDAAYALVVDELAEQGVPRAQVVAGLDGSLAEPLPDELSAEEWERRRRRRIAEENRAATDRLAAMSEMPMRGDRS